MGIAVFKADIQAAFIGSFRRCAFFLACGFQAANRGPWRVALWLCTLAWATVAVLNLVNLIRERHPSVGMVPLAIGSLLACALPCVPLAASIVGLLACVVSVASFSVVAFLGLWCRRLAQALVPRVPIPEDACIICLGGATDGGRPLPTLKNRLDLTAGLMLEEPARVAIVSGASPEPGAESEASVMCAYLVESGVDRDRILLEDKARTTRENLTRSFALAQGMGRDRDMVICSSDYHLYRALREAASQGISAIPAPARTPRLSAPQQWCREVLTVVATYGPF